MSIFFLDGVNQKDVCCCQPVTMAVEIMPPTKYKALAVSVSEAGRILGVSRPTIYALIADGDLKIKKAKGRTLIPMWSLEAFIGAPGE